MYVVLKFYENRPIRINILINSINNRCTTCIYTTEEYATSRKLENLKLETLTIFTGVCRMN